MRLLSLDPGEETGYALFDGEVPVNYGHFPTWAGLPALIRNDRPDHIVVERFGLYAHKAAALTGSEMVPAQVIGVIRFMAEQHGIPVTFQPASLIHAGGTLTPPLAKLVAPYENRTSPPYSHIQDALAHGFYALRFGRVAQPVEKT